MPELAHHPAGAGTATAVAERPGGATRREFVWRAAGGLLAAVEHETEPGPAVAAAPGRSGGEPNDDD